MRVAVTGSSGLLGSAVTALLRQRGDRVTRVVRSRGAAAEPDAIFWDPEAGDPGATTGAAAAASGAPAAPRTPAPVAVDLPGLAGHDAVVGLAGENIAGVWTASKKDRIYGSRVRGTRLMATAIARLPEGDRPGAFVTASAIGYFGDRPPDEPMTEASPPGDGFMARVVRDWEAAADAARDAGVRVVHLRFGVVLDPDALILQALSLATRLGLGATIGDGAQVFPWVTRDDVVALVLFALDTPALEGPVNAAAPERTTNRELADTLARVLGRPRLLRVPKAAFGLLGGLGEEVTGGAWVVPEKLESAGYPWRDPVLEPALRRMLDRP